MPSSKLYITSARGDAYKGHILPRHSMCVTDILIAESTMTSSVLVYLPAGTTQLQHANMITDKLLKSNFPVLL
jgi:hypothetical protein